MLKHRFAANMKGVMKDDDVRERAVTNMFLYVLLKCDGGSAA